MSAAGEDIVQHLSSNSNPSSSKLAKLEARMAGKAVSVPPPSPPHYPVVSAASAPTFMEQEELPESSSSSDDDNGEEFLIQKNTLKRPRSPDDDRGLDLGNFEGSANAAAKVLDVADARLPSENPSRKKQGRGRGRGGTGRGRGSKTVDQTRHTSASSVTVSNGQHDKLTNMEELSLLRGKVAFLEEELNKSRQEATEYRQLSDRLTKELKDFKDQDQQKKSKQMKVLSDLLIAVSKAERQEARMKLKQESFRLGNIGVMRAGTVISETWEDGQAIKDLNAHLKSLLETKEAVERHRKSLKKRQSSDKGDGSDAETSMSEEDFLLQDEICKSRLTSIKREEEQYLRERDRYELEKGRLIREMKRLRDEDGSRFNNFQILHHRYALLNLLGKGGFSEVYKAFDLVEYKYVACKLHGLNAQWSEEKKQSYIRHAIREYNIHKTLVHTNIVRLWDIFEIDHNTFCTVLEYCSGKDLDAVLKATPILPEKEARIIIVQVFQGLVYLNKKAQKIIHYDLKPGNVLFDDVGVTKVTDFGLSKIVEDDVGSQGMELTSQGAGTYWYLPPECFDLSRTPFISSKVDVWSAGVMFYQMLYGRRPFGHDQTQERILREDTIINARKVEFPSKPTVSNEAKELIRRCLTYNQSERPDVLSIAQDPYLSYSKR
ncbi:serine/threonine-protein kinase TOUSLED isoform X2 [Hordeum vulgare subsp. vulgare]|uniref:serine/threonine-protein kinase TOUSLED isoform X2 n=1 Tax=Hordeum vulgare subsp. vulgare TaxID=112509 RepID=UPI000B47CAE7|nr:serine/threonine-protein kinase TOUSLED isoform X2 [Hordeum vulgare subsp. vulgare]